MITQAKKSRPFVALAVAVAVFLVLILGIALARHFGQVDSLAAKRVGAIGIGLVLISAGNLVPKLRLFHLPQLRPDSAAAAERFAGWALVLAGMAVVGLWLFAPGENTVLISSAAATVAFGLVLAAWGPIALRGRATSSESPTDGDDSSRRAALMKRWALFQILFGLFWAFAMFLGDSLWGRDVVLWMVVIFGIALSASSLPLVRLLQSRRSE